MRLTTAQHESICEAIATLTSLIYNQDTNPVERQYFSETRDKLEAVRLMAHGESK